jgi:hypothetical protein
MRLQVEVSVHWSWVQVVDSEALRQYNAVQRFMLAMKRAKHTLDRSPRVPASPLLHIQLNHFVTNLQQYCLDGERIQTTQGAPLSTPFSTLLRLFLTAF